MADSSLAVADRGVQRSAGVQAAGDTDVSGDGELSGDGDVSAGKGVPEAVAEGLRVWLPADGAAPPQATRSPPAAMLKAIRFTTKGATVALSAWLRVLNQGGR